VSAVVQYCSVDLSAFNNLPVMLHCDDINTTVRFGRAKTDL
jgi:hypothetical protein